MMTDRPDAASPPATHAGQAIYTPFTLALYDTVVLRLSNPLIWRCPTGRILRLYDEHCSAEHLDIGVGTGWYLDHARCPYPAPRIALMDLNASALDTAARRLARYQPETYRADMLTPPLPPIAAFGSISMTYLLHCLPGDLQSKAVVFDHLLPLLQPDGVLFGATLLSTGIEPSAAARALMRAYNRKGIFSNQRDSHSDLREGLEQRFRDVAIEVIGCVALFVARDPRKAE